TAFVGGDRLGSSIELHVGPQDGSELLLIAIDPSPLDHDIAVRLGHLQGIVNRPDGLLFERTRPAVLTLNGIEGGIRESGRLPATEVVIDADGCLSSIGKSGSRVVTTGTGNPIIWTNLRQDRVASLAQFWRHN
ncbi:MAG: hypothetical protein ABI856_18850, partial [Nitrospira sp.]